MRHRRACMCVPLLRLFDVMRRSRCVPCFLRACMFNRKVCVCVSVSLCVICVSAALCLSTTLYSESRGESEDCKGKWSRQRLRQSKTSRRGKERKECRKCVAIRKRIRVLGKSTQCDQAARHHVNKVSVSISADANCDGDCGIVADGDSSTPSPLDTHVR